LSAEVGGNYSTLFDFGGIIGGIIAGATSDHSGKPATTCASLLLIGTGALSIFHKVSQQGHNAMILALFATGALVNGPYALITTAISADLGTHESLQGNSHALATVTSIIDGTGSVGAALGPLLVGLISDGGSWDGVFTLLMVCNIVAVVCLLRLVKKDCFW
jgi:OPA family glycerol-3-phosphate transporter-like MFS transporter 1/2